MYVYTVQHGVLLRKSPLGANSLQCFFFQIKEKLWLLKLNLDVKNKLESGNLDLTIYKRLEWKILTKEIWFYLSV